MSDTGTPRFPLLTVFFPMWNEEEYLERALDAAREACRTLIEVGEIGDYELLVIDDASTAPARATYGRSTRSPTT